MEWMTRGQCGPWPLWLAALYIVANLGIFIAYFLLPIGLVAIRKHGFVIGTSQQTVLWALFILFCGIGHLIENVGAFVAPNYYVFTAWHLITACLSLYTAVTFPIAAKKIINEIMELRQLCKVP